MDFTVLLASLAAAGAVALLSIGVWSAVSAERERVALRVNRTGIGLRQRPQRASDIGLEEKNTPTFLPVDRELSRFSWADGARRQLHKAGINLHVSEFIVLRVVATGVVTAVALVIALITDELLVAIGGVVAGAVVWWQVGAYVRRRIRRREKSIEDHLDDGLVNISGSLRAGFSFPQACQMALPQLPWPLDEELGEMLEEVNVGASLDDALRHLAERIEIYEMDITVNAVLVQRQVGGSLAEILENVAKTLRERRELRGQVLALTAQQRLSAYFVAGVPVGMGAFLSITNWEFMSPLFTTLTGNIFLGLGIALDVMGFLVMKRLLKIDY